MSSFSSSSSSYSVGWQWAQCHGPISFSQSLSFPLPLFLSTFPPRLLLLFSSPGRTSPSRPSSSTPTCTSHRPSTAWAPASSSWSVGLSVSQSNSQSICLSFCLFLPVSQSASLSVGRSVGQSGSRSLRQPVISASHLFSQSLTQPTSQSLCQPLTQSLCQPVSQFSQPLTQSVSQSIIQSGGTDGSGWRPVHPVTGGNGPISGCLVGGRSDNLRTGSLLGSQAVC